MSSPKEFWWLAVFESFVTLDVEQPDGSVTRQAVAQKWSRTGRARLTPSQSTEDVVSELVKGCRESTGVSQDALLVNLVILPLHLVGNVE
jgi:hypothetical protein